MGVLSCDPWLAGAGGWYRVGWRGEVGRWLLVSSVCVDKVCVEMFQSEEAVAGSVLGGM